MSDILRFVKNLVRPAVYAIRSRQLRRQLRRKLQANLASANSGYEFTDADIGLYVSEQFARLPACVTEGTESPELVTVNVNEKKIFWPASLSDRDLPWLYHEIFDDFTNNPSSYDHPELGYENREWIIDAGAAEGYFSIFALEKSPGLLFCLEPLPIMKMALEKTLDSYSNEKRAKVISAALSDIPGWADIQVDDEHICDSKLISNTSAMPSAQSDTKIQRVPITTLDQLGIEQSLGKGGLIKMDIEGYEMAALSGAVNLMKNHKPALAVAVYHDLENAKKCAEIIKAANPAYKIEFRGCYGYFEPPRPYMVFAY
ncbi:MAG: FkbM family methyltransferase [Sideroxydans sp.]|jgi:FkbM family methyltransferase